jgi:PAS domain S-box-containing protein
MLFRQNERGEAWQIVNAAFDVTEQKQKDEALKRSEERFRSLIENSPDIVSILGLDGAIRYQSPSITRILGYQPEELIGKKALEFIHPDDGPQMVESFSRMVQQPEASQNLSCRFRSANGSWRVLDGTRTTFLDDSGEMVAVVILRDVTEPKRAEEALRISEERLRLLLESAKDYAIVTFDGEGRVNSWNSGAERAFGYSEAEIPRSSGSPASFSSRRKIVRRALLQRR